MPVREAKKEEQGYIYSSCMVISHFLLSLFIPMDLNYHLVSSLIHYKITSIYLLLLANMLHFCML